MFISSLCEFRVRKQIFLSMWKMWPHLCAYRVQRVVREPKWQMRFSGQNSLLIRLCAIWICQALLKWAHFLIHNNRMQNVITLALSMCDTCNNIQHEVFWHALMVFIYLIWRVFCSVRVPIDKMINVYRNQFACWHSYRLRFRHPHQFHRCTDEIQLHFIANRNDSLCRFEWNHFEYYSTIWCVVWCCLQKSVRLLMLIASRLNRWPTI